ncbi:unnamed protein product [Caenorhabditis sp. 36 PRJEB53466]|nr:unnamed protein product [Caenorhabditis sp. 36 PRJEB53466]
MSLVEKCVGIDPNVRKPLEIGLIWEGNYWDDQDVHDCCELDWETCEILVRKIAKALLQTYSPVDFSTRDPAEKESVLIFLPKIMQLPLTILATYRAGLVAIILDPLTTKTEILEEVLLAEQPKLVITVDAFWQAQELIQVKNRVEDLRGMEDTQLLVIRHVAPNSGVPPPRKHFPARRPSYKCSLDLRNGKDLEWSTVMSETQIDDSGRPEFEWKKQDVVVKFYNENEGRCTSVSKSQLLSSMEIKRMGLDAKMRETDGSVENLMVLDAPNDLETLVQFLVPWYLGKAMTLYEGPLDYPDSSRLSQIIAKHSINVLLGSRSNYRIPNPEYLKFFATPTLKFVDFPTHFPHFSD